MAAKAELGGILMSQHMAVGGAVDFVTGGAALDAGRFVFVEIWTTFVGVAFETGFVFETGQPPGYGGSVGIVTGGTTQYAFLETMTLVHLKLCDYIPVTGCAEFAAVGAQQSAFFMRGVDRVALGTIHTGFGVWPGHKRGIGVEMAFHTGVRFLHGAFAFECQNGPGLSFFFDM